MFNRDATRQSQEIQEWARQPPPPPFANHRERSVSENENPLPSSSSSSSPPCHHVSLPPNNPAPIVILSLSPPPNSTANHTRSPQSCLCPSHTSRRNVPSLPHNFPAKTGLPCKALERKSNWYHPSTFTYIHTHPREPTSRRLSNCACLFNPSVCLSVCIHTLLPIHNHPHRPPPTH